MSTQHLRHEQARAPSARHTRSASITLAAFVITTITMSLWIELDRAVAVTNGVIGIRPAAESDFVNLSLYPGAATEAVAMVSNQSFEPVTLLIYPVDGEGTPQGTFAFGAQGDALEGAGRWISLEIDEVTIPAQSEVPVAFTVAVPQGTPPGDYAGGIIIQPPAVVGEVTDVGDGTAVRLDVVQRQGLRVYVEVAGVAAPALTTGALTWEQRDGAIRFSLPLENTGNTILHPTGGVSVSGPIGVTDLLTFDAPESILPGATFTMIAELAEPPLVQWSTAQATVESEAGVTSVMTEFVVIPWLLLSILVVVLVVAVIVFARTVGFVRRARVALAQVQLPVAERRAAASFETGSTLTAGRTRRRAPARSRKKNRRSTSTQNVAPRKPRHRL